MKKILLALLFLTINQAQAFDYADIARGIFKPKTKSVVVYGKNADIDAAANETLNNNGGTISFPTSANKINVASTNNSGVKIQAGLVITE